MPSADLDDVLLTNPPDSRAPSVGAHFAVCVLGAGPAGLAVTSRLMAHGRDVLVLDRPPMRKPWGGETFTGAIRGPLAELGFWEAFEGAGHVAGYERQSAWGGEPQAESTMFRTSGALWHVDRDRFNTDLRAAVVDRGGVFATYRRLETLRRESGRWRISLDNGMEVSATYLVDATGRMRILARRLGARIDVHDRLMGLTAKVSREEGSTEIRSMLIEATPFGWWYAAPTPTGHILALFTDADLAPVEIRRCLRPVAANSVFTHLDGEADWLPVGDACASHDPLCGWGVQRALTNGLLAADAIEVLLASRDSSPLAAYRHHCHQQYQRYLEGLSRRYSIEHRWPTATFWKRRTPTRVNQGDDDADTGQGADIPGDRDRTDRQQPRVVLGA